MAMRGVRILAAVVTGMLVLTSCGAETPATSTASPAASDQEPATSSPSEGGSESTLSIGWEESGIDTLDPAIAYDYVSWPAIQLIFETLVAYAYASSELEPRLAEAMPEISADGTVYTFTLREGVDFVRADGTVHRAMTVDDVVASLNRVLSPNLTPTPSPVGEAFFGNIVGAAEVLAGEATEASGIEAVDERTVRITLRQPDGTFLNKMATPFASVVPTDLMGDDTAAASDDPVGTGPYLLAEHRTGEEARFVRNPAYWGTPGEASEIVFRLNMDGNALVQEVEANRIDIMGTTIPSGVWPTIRDDPTYEGRIHELTQLAIQYLTMDTSGPDSPFASLEVRQAVSYAIDRQNLIDVFAGRADELRCIYPPALPGFNPGCEGYGYDPEAARELMADAGFEDGFATKLYTDPSEDSLAMTQSIQQDLAEIGIEVEIVPQAWEVLLETIVVPHEAPMVYIGWFADYPDPSNFYDPILSCASAVEGGVNISWFCDEELDALAAEANAEQDEQARFELYAELERQAMEQAPFASLLSPTSTILVSDRVDFHQHPVWTFDLARVPVRD